MTPKGVQDNLDVDFVVKYAIDCKNKAASTKQFQKLVRCLSDVGLETEVRHGDTPTTLFVFVKARNDQNFADVVFRARVRDWLHGVCQVQPVKETAETLANSPITEAERYRLVYGMITSLREDGGAGITPGYGQWKGVEAVFPLHNHARNKKWLTEFASKTFLTPEDLDHIRDCVGERGEIAYYYAFLQSYFQFLMFPAAFGFSVWILLGNFSPVYAIVNGLWCITFVEWWKRQERELSIRWGVKHVGSIEYRRKEFKPAKTVKDPITGEDVAFFPSKERLQRQSLQVPLAFVSVVALGAIISTCFAIEIFLAEVYDGPFKSVLTFTPTILLTLSIPTVSNFLTSYAKQLTDYENYETQAAYDQAMVSKVFVINFITSFLGIFLTAFVYVPFAAILVPYLDVFSLTVRPFAENVKQLSAPSPSQFNIDPQRLPNQMFYFAVTAQVVNFAMETIMPIVTKKGTDKVKDFQSRRAKAQGGAAPALGASDHAEEKEFLARVREEASLPCYDVTTDLREMCIQFGYLALFSVVWPLTPVSYFVNNWIELRGDTFKLTVESRRPVPERADSIGPWLDSLEFLAWLGSITSAALVYMFSDGGLGPDGRPSKIKLGYLLLSVFLSEHIFLVVRQVVRHAISKLDSANMRKERSERLMVRRKFLEESGLGDAVKSLSSPANSPLNESFGADAKLNTSFTRNQLEEDARDDSLHDTSPSTRFWKRQRGWQESEVVGIRYIEMMESADDKKSK